MLAFDAFRFRNIVFVLQKSKQKYLSAAAVWSVENIPNVV